MSLPLNEQSLLLSYPIHFNFNQDQLAVFALPCSLGATFGVSSQSRPFCNQPIFCAFSPCQSTVSWVDLLHHRAKGSHQKKMVYLGKFSQMWVGGFTHLGKLSQTKTVCFLRPLLSHKTQIKSYSAKLLANEKTEC